MTIVTNSASDAVLRSKFGITDVVYEYPRCRVYYTELLEKNQ